MVPLKTSLVDAWKTTFAQSGYPVEDFGPDDEGPGVHVSIEFPAKPQDYPGVWIDYEPISTHIIGVDHKEYIDSITSGMKTAITRWRFEGNASFTIVALSSLERDRLYDEVIAAIAFGRENIARAAFRRTLEDNEFIAVDANWDEVTTGGTSANTGTPWLTDDIIYEVTVTMRLVGDFAATPGENTGQLVALSAIKVYPIVRGETDPTTTDGWV